MIARNFPPAGRAGTTLTEVLMSLLVMGIGLVSVASLFPASLRRSIEATQLTNATLLRMNAEARIKALATPNSTPPGLLVPGGIVNDPDMDGDIEEHARAGDRFIFDPLGASVLAADGALYGDGSPRADYFAGFDNNGDAVLDAPLVRFGVPVYRTTAGIGTVADAENFVTLPDSFITLSDQLAGTFSYAPAGPTITTAASGPSLAEFIGQTVRITALHADIRSSAVRYGTVDGANSITLTSSLPADFTNATIGRLLVDLPERRYTWIATVRWSSGSPSVTVVVFFRRNFSPEDEQVWICEEPAGSYNEYTWKPPLNGGAATEPPPGLEVGGHMFDVSTFRWWKIASLQKTTVDGVPNSLRIGVDPEEIDPSAEGRLYNSDPALDRSARVIFPRNVVDTYTLQKN